MSLYKYLLFRYYNHQSRYYIVVLGQIVSDLGFSRTGRIHILFLPLSLHAAILKYFVLNWISFLLSIPRRCMRCSQCIINTVHITHVLTFIETSFDAGVGVDF